MRALKGHGAREDEERHRETVREKAVEKRMLTGAAAGAAAPCMTAADGLRRAMAGERRGRLGRGYITRAPPPRVRHQPVPWACGEW